MSGLGNEIRKRLGLEPQIRIHIKNKVPIVKPEPTPLTVRAISAESTPGYFKQEGDVTMCVSFAVCNALLMQLRKNNFEGLLPFVPKELFRTIQNVDGAIDSSTGMLTQLGVVNLFAAAQRMLNISNTPVDIEGCKDFDVLFKGLCDGKSAVIFYEEKAHELAILSYDKQSDNLVVFDSLGDGLTKTYRFHSFKNKIEWGAVGTANRLISFRQRQAK